MPKNENPFTPYEEPVIALSTSHLTEMDKNFLEVACDTGDTSIVPVIAYRHAGYGYQLYIAEDSDKTRNTPSENMRRYGFSAYLTKLVEDASRHGYTWLLLDRDAPHHPDYPRSEE